jgi:hypothetical protein
MDQSASRPKLGRLPPARFDDMFRKQGGDQGPWYSPYFWMRVSGIDDDAFLYINADLLLSDAFGSIGKVMRRYTRATLNTKNCDNSGRTECSAKYYVSKTFDDRGDLARNQNTREKGKAKSILSVSASNGNVL